MTEKTNFNSHAHVERDGNKKVATLQPIEFQLTRSRGAWLKKPLGVWDFEDFNSHAHVERDYFASGLTNEQLNFNSHAHVERDGMGFWGSLFKIHFNSHAHVERDNVSDM